MLICRFTLLNVIPVQLLSLFVEIYCFFFFSKFIRFIRRNANIRAVRATIRKTGLTLYSRRKTFAIVRFVFIRKNVNFENVLRDKCSRSLTTLLTFGS